MLFTHLLIFTTHNFVPHLSTQDAVMVAAIVNVSSIPVACCTVYLKGSGCLFSHHSQHFMFSPAQPGLRAALSSSVWANENQNQNLKS